MKLYTTIFTVILLVPVILFSIYSIKSNYAKSKLNISQEKQDKSITISTIRDLFGLEMNVPNENWTSIVENTSGSKDSFNRYVSIRVGNTTNAIHIQLHEFEKETKQKVEGNPNGESLNDFSKYREFNSSDKLTIVIDNSKEQKIGRLYSNPQKTEQVLVNLNDKKMSPHDLNKQEPETTIMFNTRFELFQQYTEKYPDRILLVEIHYSEPFQFSYSDYDLVVKSLKLTDF